VVLTTNFLHFPSREAFSSFWVKILTAEITTGGCSGFEGFGKKFNSGIGLYSYFLHWAYFNFLICTGKELFKARGIGFPIDRGIPSEKGYRVVFALEFSSTPTCFVFKALNLPKVLEISIGREYLGGNHNGGIAIVDCNNRGRAFTGGLISPKSGFFVFHRTGIFDFWKKKLESLAFANSVSLGTGIQGQIFPITSIPLYFFRGFGWRGKGPRATPDNKGHASATDFFKVEFLYLPGIAKRLASLPTRGRIVYFRMNSSGYPW